MRNGYYFTKDYAGERNLSLRPGHPMEGVKYYAAVGVWAGDQPVAMICVDQLISGADHYRRTVGGITLFRRLRGSGD